MGGAESEEFAAGRIACQASRTRLAPFSLGRGRLSDENRADGGNGGDGDVTWL